MSRQILIIKLLNQFLRFGFVGIFVTFLGVFLYYIFLEILLWPLYPVYCLVFLLCVSISYLLNSKMTFRSNYRKQDSINYFFVYGASFCIGLLILSILDLIFIDISDFYLTLIVIPPRFLLQFGLVKFFIFNKN